MANNITHRLICIRHGESIYNQENRFTGQKNIALTSNGIAQAEMASELCSGLNIDHAFSSTLSRCIDTLAIVCQHREASLPKTQLSELNERDYGDLNGLNKAEAAKTFGHHQVQAWRRGFNDRPPNGESLKDTYQRVTRIYKSHIAAHLKAAKNILMVAHGNSLRALIGYLTNTSQDAFEHIEISWATPWIFEFKQDTLCRIRVLKNPLHQGKDQIQANADIIQIETANC